MDSVWRMRKSWRSRIKVRIILRFDLACLAVPYRALPCLTSLYLTFLCSTSLLIFSSLWQGRWPRPLDVGAWTSVLSWGWVREFRNRFFLISLLLYLPPPLHIQSFVHTSIHSFVHTSIRLFIRSFIHSLFIRSYCHSFILSYFHSFIHSLTSISSFVPSIDPSHSFLTVSVLYYQSGSVALMEFNRNTCSLRTIPCTSPLYFVVADLKVSTDLHTRSQLRIHA